MGERLIDLDAAPSSAPFKGWSRRNSLTLVVAVLAVVAAILAALAWPEPRPVPEVVGLRQTPVPAWTLAGAAYPGRDVRRSGPRHERREPRGLRRGRLPRA